MRQTRLIFMGWCLFSILARSAAWADDLALRGFLRDKSTGSPVGGARISVAGARSRADQVSDDGGFFHLALPALPRGSLVRLRIEKDGYVVVDRNVSVSEELPLDVALTPVTTKPGAPAAVPPTMKDAFLEQLKSTDPALRASAAAFFGRRGIPDATTIRVIATALQDPDTRVRIEALDAIVAGKLTAPALLPSIAVRFSDPQPDVAVRALSVVKLFGKSARPLVPELLTEFEDTSQQFFQVRSARVRSLLALGDYRDPRLAKSLVSLLLYDLNIPGQADDLLAAADRHPELLLSQLDRLEGVLDGPTDQNSANAQRAAIVVLVHAGPAGRKILLRQAARGDRRDPLSRATYLLSWMLNDARAREDIAHSLLLDSLLSRLRLSLQIKDTQFTPMLFPDSHVNQPLSSHVVAATGRLGLGSALDDETWKPIDTALHEPTDLATVQFVVRALPTFPKSAKDRVLTVALDVLAQHMTGDCDTPGSTSCGDWNLLDTFTTALSSYGDETTLVALTLPAGCANPRVNALARRAMADIRARLAPPTAPAGVSD